MLFACPFFLDQYIFQAAEFALLTSFQNFKALYDDRVLVVCATK